MDFLLFGVLLNLTYLNRMINNKKKLDCLLISPPVFYESDENIWTEINSNFPPLGIASVAGYVRSKNYSVRIIDCNIESPSVEDFEKYFKENYVNRYLDVKYIGFTTMTCTIKKTYKILEICKKYYPDAIIVFGGVHATFMSREVISKKIFTVLFIKTKREES